MPGKKKSFKKNSSKKITTSKSQKTATSHTSTTRKGQNYEIINKSNKYKYVNDEPDEIQGTYHTLWTKPKSIKADETLGAKPKEKVKNIKTSQVNKSSNSFVDKPTNSGKSNKIIDTELKIKPKEILDVKPKKYIDSIMTHEVSESSLDEPINSRVSKRLFSEAVLKKRSVDMHKRKSLPKLSEVIIKNKFQFNSRKTDLHQTDLQKNRKNLLLRQEAGEVSKIMLIDLPDEKEKPSKFDFVEPPDIDRVHLKFAIIWMELCGIIHLSLMLAYSAGDNFLRFVNKNPLIPEYNFLFLSHYFTGSCTIFICGNAIIIFRVFNKSRLRSIKYFHISLHTVGLLTCLLTIYAYKQHLANTKLPQHNYSTHAKLGIVGTVGYFAQYIIGMCVYLMKIYKQKFRIQFYHYHSYIGFVLFFLTVLIMVSGLVSEEHIVILGFSSNRFTFSWLPKLTAITGIIFSGAVLFIIVYPYFDFAMVLNVLKI